MTVNIIKKYVGAGGFSRPGSASFAATCLAPSLRLGQSVEEVHPYAGIATP